MDILIGITILLAFTIVPLKVGTNILKIKDADLANCFVAVILSIIATLIVTMFLGKGFFPSCLALIVTGGFFSLFFKINIMTGFLLATISMGIQMIVTLIAVRFGFDFFS